MYVSLNWLRDFVDLPKDLNPEELGKLITLRSAEVEEVVDQTKAFDKIVLGKVTKIRPHPNADKLQIAEVNIGDETVQIVCGGSNLKEGLLSAVALPGAIVKWHGEETIEMKVAKVRGEESHGMICTSEEIGMPQGEDERELMDLSHVKGKPGTPIASILRKDDTIFEIDNKTLTHRPDLWGHIGIAREIAAITASNFKVKVPNISTQANTEGPSITVNDVDLCPRYMGVIIRGIKVAESPEWMKNRLIATDHNIYNNIVDMTNYVMEEVGQPIHAFDLRKVDDGIIVRTAHKGEKLKMLDGEEYDLDESMLMITDKNKPLAIAGVMGGKDSGISNDTVDILIEVANFDAISVRQTSVKTGLRTDAVQRFEKSLDPRQCEHALKRAIELVKDFCPDAEVSMITDVANFDESEPLIGVDPNRVRQKIGVDIPATEMANYLTNLGFELQGKISDSVQNFLVKVPSFRATKDVNIEDDIIEEIARMYGYENIPAIIPDLPAKVPQPNHERFSKHLARDLMAHALHHYETYNYSFYSKETISMYGLNEDKHYKLKNYLSEDQSHLRTTMVPNLVRTLREAIKYENDAKLFEIGRVYENIGKFMPKETKRIASVSLIHKSDSNPFAHVKGDLEQFFELFKIDGVKFVENEEPADYMHPYQNAAILLRGKIIGHTFTLHPAIVEAEDFDHQVACFELNFRPIHEARKINKAYEKESKFPSIEFDISVLVDKKTQVATLEHALYKNCKKLLKKVKLFDAYEGDKIDANKKSLAFRLTLQANDRTLSSSDLENAQKASWKALEDLGGTIRGK